MKLLTFKIDLSREVSVCMALEYFPQAVAAHKITQMSYYKSTQLDFSWKSADPIVLSKAFCLVCFK